MSSQIAYLDCPMGIAGDMCLGALVSAGVPLAYFIEIVEKLGLSAEIQLTSQLVHRSGQEAVKVHVSLTPTDRHVHRHLADIEQIIQQAHLDSQIELWSLTSFRRLAIAESQVHGIPLEQVHFHEVGALDAIADIVCTCAGFHWLGIKEVHCSALPTGGGYVQCEHGLLPVPVPAVLKLWQTYQVPVFSNGIAKELVTPTGAALAVGLSHRFGTAPQMQLQKVGLGAGSQDLAIPNILRLWIGNSTASESGTPALTEIPSKIPSEVPFKKKLIVHSH